MLRNRIYYQLKPFIPRALRSAVRRRIALRLEARVQDVWPIMPGSEQTPPGWLGWPDGKKFALVLTHDVEGPVGLRRCRRLAKLESELGVRSCFNFIPLGNTPFRPSYARNLLPMASKLACMISITTAAFIAPGAVLSEKPGRLMNISPIGKLR